MGEFEEKLNQILSSPEAMGQIMSLASSLQSGDQEGKPEEGAPTAPQEAVPLPSPPSGGAGQAGPEGILSALGDLDAGTARIITTLFREYDRSEDEKTALLAALRPFLRQERQERLDRAIQLTRVSRVIRTALKLFQGGGGDV